MTVTAIVIDDDIDTAETFAEHLDLNDVKILGIGNNGKEAVELYKEHKPNVVLMDVMMEGFDGFYGIEKIREYDSNAKIVMITADLQAETEKKLKELKTNGVVHKPYEITTVLETIKNAIHGTA